MLTRNCFGAVAFLVGGFGWMGSLFGFADGVVVVARLLFQVSFWFFMVSCWFTARCFCFIFGDCLGFE